MLSILLVTGLANGSIYALVALGIVVLVKATDSVNGAHGDAATLGCYVTFSVLATLALGPGLALMAVAASSVAIGLVTFLLIRRLFSPAHTTSLLIGTIGLSFVLRGAIRAIWGGRGDYIAVPPMSTMPPIFIGSDVILPIPQLIIAGGAALILAAFVAIFQFTRIGLFMRAVADNPKAALIVGINTQATLCFGFVLSVLVAALSGYLIAPTILIYPDLGFVLFLKGFAAAVLGGLYSLPGAVLGGILVGLIEALAAGYISTKLQDISSFVIIMLSLSFLPNGLIGRARQRTV